MKRIIISFREALRISASHKILSFLLVIQVCCTLCLSVSVINYVLPSKQEIKGFKEDVLEKSYFRLHEFLDDTFYTMYMEKENYGYEAMRNTLCQIAEENKYLILMEQPVVLYEKNLPEVCLEGYEEGDYESSLSIEEGKASGYVKSYQVSDNIWEESQIKLEEGKAWKDSEIEYESGKEIPIILGSAYKESYSLKDVLRGEYLGEEFSFCVVGFIEEGENFTNGEAVYLCDRYIFLPSVISQTPVGKVTEFHKMQLLQQYNGVVVTEKNYNEVEQEIKSIVENNGLNYGKDIILTNPGEEESILKTYSAISDTLLKQYYILLVILIFFIIASTSVTITGFVKKHQYDLGVFLLCGAKEKDIYLIIEGIAGMLILTGDIIAMVIMAIGGQYQIGIICSQGIAIGILILSGIIPCIYMKKYQMNELINWRKRIVEMISLKDITVQYGKGEGAVNALTNINLKINKGEFVMIRGRSGCGKSTLLNVLSGLVKPSAGNYILKNEDITNYSKNQFSQLRNRKIGIVVQHYALIDNMTIYENISLPLEYGGYKRKEREQRIDSLLKKFGIEDKAVSYPAEISGGQKQRAAIARAIACQPSILLADEPTGALDEDTGKAIMKIFQELNEKGMTIVMVTHDKDLISFGTREIIMADGRILESSNQRL